jgi:hypothetical protein
MKEPDTAEEPEQLKRDFDTAMALLWGLTTPLKAVLRRRSQSAKTTPYRDFAAVREVWRRRLLDKESYENATANTAAAFGYADPSQIRKLFGRDKELWKVWLSLRKRAPDRQTMIRVLEEASVALDRQTRE